MSKKFGVLGLCMIVLLGVGIFVAAADSELINSPIGEEISLEVQNYIEGFAEKKGIEGESINEINKVDFENLPKEVNIENVDDTNLAIYEVDYEEGGETQKVFVITYSVEELKAQGDLIIAHDKRQFLNFGFDGAMDSARFLETATGVEGSLEQGYVMMRKGSITGLSTSLEVIEEGEGQIEIIIYKNGEQVGFENALNGALGVQKDYDIQSNDVVNFEPGDVISVYANAKQGLVWKDVITILEITTTN